MSVPSRISSIRETLTPPSNTQRLSQLRWHEEAIFFRGKRGAHQRLPPLHVEVLTPHSYVEIFETTGLDPDSQPFNFSRAAMALYGPCFCPRLLTEVTTVMWHPLDSLSVLTDRSALFLWRAVCSSEGGLEQQLWSTWRLSRRFWTWLCRWLVWGSQWGLYSTYCSKMEIFKSVCFDHWMLHWMLQHVVRNN